MPLSILPQVPPIQKFHVSVALQCWVHFCHSKTDFFLMIPNAETFQKHWNCFSGKKLVIFDTDSSFPHSQRGKCEWQPKKTNFMKWARLGCERTRAKLMRRLIRLRVHNDMGMPTSFKIVLFVFEILRSREPSCQVKQDDKQRLYQTIMTKNKISIQDFRKKDYRGFIFLVHQDHGLMLLHCTRKKNKPPHWQLPGGHVDEHEFVTAGTCRL